MDYDTINNKILELIEENYSNRVFKAMKLFKIILTGYNFSQQKNLRIFEENGWVCIVRRISSDFVHYKFVNYLSTKIFIVVPIRKRMEDGTLDFDFDYDFMLKDVYMSVNIDRSDEIFELLERIENIKIFRYYDKFGNDSIKYNTIHCDNMYKLFIWYSGVSSW